MTCKKFTLGKQVNIHQCTVNVFRILSEFVDFMIKLNNYAPLT